MKMSYARKGSSFVAPDETGRDGAITQARWASDGRAERDANTNTRELRALNVQSPVVHARKPES